MVFDNFGILKMDDSKDACIHPVLAVTGVVAKTPIKTGEASDDDHTNDSNCH